VAEKDILRAICMLRTLPAEVKPSNGTFHVPTALARAWFGIVLAAVSAPGQVNVAMGQYDLGRTSTNPAEIVLNTTNVNSSQFGLLFTLPVDGFIFGQPLYLSGVMIQGATRNVVYVATMNNSVYAFDADNPGVGAPLWQVNLGPVSTATLSQRLIQTTLGIMSTPVIDPVGGIIYVVDLTVQNSTPIYQLHALSMTTGLEQFDGPVTIQASVPGTAADSVNGQIPFNAAIQWQRAALLFNNGSIYIGFGSAANESQTYHGWLLQYDASNLQRIQAYNTTPNGNGGGVWMSGGGPAADDTGVYYAIGNGSFDISGDTGESVIWLGPSSTASFTSFDYAMLNTDDLDLGSTATMLLPNTNLLVVGAKDGSLYVLNRSNLGGLQSGNTQAAQYFLGTIGCAAGLPPSSGTCSAIHHLTTWGLTSSPLLLYVWGAGDILRAYSLSNDGTFNTTPFATGTLTAGSPGGILALSSDAQLAGTGVLWATMSTQNASINIEPGILHAFDASSLSELWNSGMNAADALGKMAKFSAPTVANGKVYVATSSDQLDVYGIHTLSSTSLTFGNQTVGTVSAAQEVNFTNGTPTPLATPSILPSGDFAATSTCGATIAPGAACVISVTFTPTAAGTRSGAVTINDSLIGSPQMIALTGYGLMPQTITFPALSSQPFGVAPFAVSATASSGLTVSFNSQTPSICTVSGTTVTLLSVGQCTIQAAQPGDGITYAAATSVSQSFQVTQAGQTITFGALSNQPQGTAPFAVTATASSGLTVGFTSLTTSVCTVSGTTVTLLAVGVCTIQATQTGGLDYTAAAPVNQSFEVTFQGLGASALLVGSAGGSSSVVLTYSSVWTASANSSFLHISAGSASGSGNALVAFTCDPFTGTGTRTGTLTIAGLTVTVTQAGTNYIGPGPVTTLVSSLLNLPSGAAVDGSGNVYITDAGNQAIYEWSALTQQLTTLVSSGLNEPFGPALDSSGNVYFADYNNNAIKEWSAATQQVTTLVSGLNLPTGVAVDKSGNVYFADSANQAIKEWSAATQQVTALVSSGLANPSGVAVDGSGNVYIADYNNNAIEEWSPSTQQLTTLVSSGLSKPQGVAVDGSGNVYFFDTGSQTIKEWSASTQQVTTLASAGLLTSGVAVDGFGNVYIPDGSNSALREIPNAFVGPASGLTEPAATGSDALLPVLPATVSLSGIFAPSSDQSWLTIGTIAGGVVNFSFTANTSASSQVAHITVLGQSITVTQNGLTAQTITFGALSNQTYGTAPITVSATAGSGLKVVFHTLTQHVCTVSGTTVTLVAVGTCTIEATQAGNANYAAAPPVTQSFQITKASQTVTFGALSNQTYGIAPITVSAVPSSGLAVAFYSLTPHPCTVSGTTVTLAAVGTCTIEATQAGNADYAAAPSVSQSFQITKASQTITFGALSNQTYGTAPITVSAVPSSGLTVAFYSLTPHPCTVSGTTVTLVAVGTCTIEATQAGNANYTTAPAVTQSFQITKASQTITFGALSNQTYGTAPITVSATASSGLTVVFYSLKPRVCTVSGTTVTLAAVGTCTIEATQAGNADYVAAPAISQSFQVSP
jgi:streptogramin lyase